MVIGMCAACSIEEEVIILPKNKKKYVSAQGCIERIVELILATNEVNRAINNLRQIIDVIQKEALEKLNDYADGEKDCFLKQANKVERTDYYEKIKKILHEMDALMLESQKIAQRLENFRVL